ncbi:hypothetical protein NPIL_621171, partial [Nephila pilipes]
ITRKRDPIIEEYNFPLLTTKDESTKVSNPVRDYRRQHLNSVVEIDESQCLHIKIENDSPEHTSGPSSENNVEIIEISPTPLKKGQDNNCNKKPYKKKPKCLQINKNSQ